MPTVTIKNTIDKTEPIKNINRAFMSSWLNRSRLVGNIFSYQVIGACASNFALWPLALRFIPVFIFLAWVTYPAIITTRSKAKRNSHA